MLFRSKISVPFDIQSNAGINHYDNTLTVLMNEKLESGTLYTFVDPFTTEDVNYLYTAQTQSGLVVTGISGVTKQAGSGLLTIQYANPTNQTTNLSQTYFISTGSTETNYKFPSDREYYQVITAITVSEAALLWNSTNQNSLPGALLASTTMLWNIRDAFGWQHSKRSTLTTSDVFADFGNQYITIIQRGVDPYSPLFINRYGIGKLLGFDNEDDLVITAKTKLNIPIKALYAEGFPEINNDSRSVTLNLRDLFFYFESMTAPQLLIRDASLSYIISTLMDSIGFSNYTFKRLSREDDPVIPFFFIAPEQNVAEVLTQLAIATQYAMFFDEYNNFVVMSKNYLLPDENDRTTDFVLSGSNNQTDSGVVKNSSSGNLPNIISISANDKRVYNDGRITYTTRYIQRTYGSLRQQSLLDREQTWIYLPVLLWEVAGTEETKTVNSIASTQSTYQLSAIPINSNLTTSVPTVSNGSVINNILDLGESVYWLTRYQGYFYASGEIIKYDAVQFNITGTGNVWISSNQEYQKYFASIPFNGKIYPTGLIRIYSLPYYETVDGNTRMKSGVVQQHGRGQFGTPVVEHTAGINDYWTNNEYVRGCNMKTEYLFTTALDEDISPPSTTTGGAGINNVLAKQTTRNGIIKNYLATNYLTETQVNNLKSIQAGTIQSSALVMNGPSFKTTETPLDFVSCVYKNLDNAYKHFGTRMRIVGKIENKIGRAHV